MTDYNKRAVFYGLSGVVILVLALLALPNFLRARTTSAPMSCTAVLQMLNGATQQWAIENRATNGQPVVISEVVKYLPYKDVDSLPLCPSGGVIRLTVAGEPPRCNIPGHHF
ncbi:MAG: hypothetical protein AB1705_10330 [Verrucomicrobiota bacterium]